MIYLVPFLILLFFLLLVFLEIPIAFSMIIAAMGFVLVYDQTFTIPFTRLGLGFTYPLLAIFFFILLGNLMNESKVSDYIVEFVRKALAVLFIKEGRTGAVAILACAACGPFTGSATGTTTAVGSIMFPQMEKHNYDPRYSTTLLSYSGILGTLIPPSIGGLIYAVLVNLPVISVWMATAGVGILYGTILFIQNLILCKRYGYDRDKVTINRKDLFKSLIDVLPSLSIPLFVFGSIYGGVATPTEAGSVGALCVLLIGKFYYKTIRTKKQLLQVLYITVRQTSVIMFLIASSFALSYTLSSTGAIKVITTSLLLLTENKIALLFIVNALVLVLGCFLDTTPIMVLLAPMVSSILVPMGIHPYHLASTFIFVGIIALVTPPVGGSLFAASAVTNVPVSSLFRYILIFFIPALITIFLISFFPQISFFIPKLLGLL